MAIHLSALKRARQNLKRRTLNRHQRSTLRTELRKFRTLLSGKDKSAAEQGYPAIQKTIDRAARKGLIHRNAAVRYKSRLAAALKKMQAA